MKITPELVEQVARRVHENWVRDLRLDLVPGMEDFSGPYGKIDQRYKEQWQRTTRAVLEAASQIAKESKEKANERDRPQGPGSGHGSNAGQAEG